MGLFRLAILTVIFLFCGLEANVIDWKPNEKCSKMLADPESESCFMRTLNFTNGLIGLGFGWNKSMNKTKVQWFQDMCGPLQKCMMINKQCDIFQSGITGIKVDDTLQYKLINTWCGFISQMEDTPCFKKVFDTDCFKKWRVDEILIEKLYDESKQRMCENLFGKKKCLRNKISKMCGRTEWTKFRNYLIKVNNIMWKSCNLKVIVWN